MNTLRKHHSLSNAHRAWVWGAVLSAVLVCILLAVQHTYQSVQLRRATLLTVDLGRAGDDASKGFLHITLGAKPDGPWQRAQGVALLQQSLRNYDRTTRGLTTSSDHAADFRQRLETFRALLTKIEQLSANPDSEFQVGLDLRLAIHELLDGADQIDSEVRGEIARLSARLETAFAWSLGLSVLLLTAMCGAVYISQRKIEESERELRANNEIWRTLSELNADWFWEQDENLRFTRWRGPQSIIPGVLPDALIGTHRWDHPAMNMSDQDWEEHKKVLQLQRPFFEFELQRLTVEGDISWVAISGTPVLDERGEFCGYRGIGRNITARKRAEMELHASEERWRFALEGAGDGVWDWNIPEGRAIFSKRWKEMLGYAEDEIGDRIEEWSDRVNSDDKPAMLAKLQLALDGTESVYTSEFLMRCKDGSQRWILARGMVLSRNPQGKPLRMVGTHADLTAQKHAQTLIWKQANFDSLTKLPNQRMLRDRLEQEIKKSQRDDHQLAVLFVDLDHFKEVNDTLGHHKGDLLLVEAARRIGQSVRASDTVSRRGGDEFALLLPLRDEKGRVEHVAQNIISTISERFSLDGENAFITASVGITIYPNDGTEIEVLLKNADQALYAAKGAGRNQFSYFTARMQADAISRVRMANDLRVALPSNQLSLVFQPIVELLTGSVHKAEALIRWRHPVRGDISPVEFIPIAEGSGLIVEIGDWVFRQAVASVKQWRQKYHCDFQVSVNKSPIQFLKTGPQTQDWFEHIQSLGLPGNSLAVEITEGLLLDPKVEVLKQLSDYRSANIGVSLDDFGTGYSSLSYLQKYPIDIVKIDRSFVTDLAPDSKNLALCKAIIVMAHELGMKVVAEGVETDEQRAMLLAAGCDYGQGYWFSKPLPVESFEQYLTSRNALRVN